MRLAVISDIHGNMEAFRAVLSDIGQSGADEIICLGDNIGYGAEPEAVLSLLWERNIFSLSGNHELAACDPARLVDFNPFARISLEKTICMLSAEAIARIRRFPLFLSKGPYRFVHGFPPDSPDIYLFSVSKKALKAAFWALKEKICFVGHTHELEIISFDGHTINQAPLLQGLMHLNENRRHIITVGSIGQPRDTTSHAKYVILDDLAQTLDTRFVPYDIEAAVEKILAAGLPRRHALRLLPPL
jgi:predicted phosphodiesterase